MLSSWRVLRKKSRAALYMQVQTDPRDKKIVQMVGTGTGHVKVDIYCPK